MQTILRLLMFFCAPFVLLACGDPACRDGKIQAQEECDDANLIEGDGCDSNCTLSACGNGIKDPSELCDDGEASNTDACLVLNGVCTPARCGDSFVFDANQNGQVDLGDEECDDGNAVNEDGCSNNCKLPSCGDGAVQAGEACDDGNDSDADDCTNQCQAAVCGDGFVRSGIEECDDQNADNTDTCTTNCKLPRCGDGFVQSGQGEECDDGDLDNSDDCTTNCKNARCGDGFEQLGLEECDDGDNDDTDSCTACKDARCGDGFRQPSNGEGCDDGNTDNADDCTNDCKSAFCGDGVVQSGVEECDDGNDSNFDDCTTACNFAFCGDGLPQLDLGEECDDQNNLDADACTNECQLAECGDGFVQLGIEQCDDDNLDNTDSCTVACQFARCGDGFTQVGVEECDDQNFVNGDDCSNLCELPRCGDNILQPQIGEECDDGDQNNGDDCPNTCLNAACGDGFVQLGIEDCDDGNNQNGDGCDADCVPTCGNGVVDFVFGEECEDTNNQDGDGCNNDCKETRVVQLDAGDSHTCALLNSGEVHCWGFADDGRLGYGNTNIIGDDELPASVGSVDIGGRAIQVSSGRAHSCALLETGSVRCWGDNDFGQLGYGNTTDVGANPFPFGQLPSTVGDVNVGGVVVQLSAGDFHTCALLDTGDVICWGNGDFGQLGYGNTLSIGDDELPQSAGNVDVGGNVVQISAGGTHSCALLDTGDVICWGQSSGGKLGYGNLNNVGDNETPASVGPVNVGGNVVQISAGNAHSCALLDNGEVRCWGIGPELGYGNLNAIGDNEAPASAGSVNVGGAVAQIEAGQGRTCAILTTGELRCWGGGFLGYGNTQVIGDNETPASAGGINIGGLATQVTVGSTHTCVLLNNSDVRCWGFGFFGPLGYGDRKDIGDDETPNTTARAIIDAPVVQVEAGQFQSCALLQSGEVRCWGRNFSGELGYGNTTPIGDNETPEAAGDVFLPAPAVQISAGRFHTCALLSTGQVSCWGSANRGQLGYGDTNNIGDNEPPFTAGVINVGGNVVQISAGGEHTCALLDTGDVRCWGDAEFGQLGYGNLDNIGDDETPASIGSVDVGGNVVQISAGNIHTCALLQSGEVRCWGNNFFGQLGYGNLDNIGDDETPQSVGSVDVGGNVVQISAGGAHTCALLDNGEVRCWGLGFVGELGYGNLDVIGDDETPASAGSINLGGRAVQITGGGGHTCALLDNGEVRCWGAGTDGQLGYGNTQNIGDDEDPISAGPVNVGGVVVQIDAGDSHTCALLSSGEMRCWGLGENGRLGYGNTQSIGDNETAASAGSIRLSSVVAVAAGKEHGCAILRIGFGLVRCWGRGASGRLGYGDQNNIGDNEAPFTAGFVDVGGTPLQLSLGGSHSCVLVGSAVRCWGEAGSGQLGYESTNDIGDAAGEMPPANVNTGGNAVQVVTGANHSCALLNTGAVKCWGRGNEGQLGYGTTSFGGNSFLGDAPAEMPPANVDVGGVVIQLAAGDNHTCALLDDGEVRCWGLGLNGRLGYRNTFNIGDNETPQSVGSILLGDFAVGLSAGSAHSCALLNTGDIRCWGLGASGQLGYKNTNDIGDNEAPAVAGNVNIGGFAVQVSAGANHTCALLDTGDVRCWGNAAQGQLGYSSTLNIGDNEAPQSAGSVDVGSAALLLGAGGNQTCAALDNGLLRCWGQNNFGQLGNASRANIGDDELPLFELLVQIF